MNSYYETEQKLMESPYHPAANYESFILGYSRSMGLVNYGGPVAQSIKSAIDTGGRPFRVIGLVAIMYGVLMKMIEVSDRPPDEVSRSAHLGSFFLGYLIDDPPLRALAMIAYNHMCQSEVGLQSSTIEEVEKELVLSNSRVVGDLVGVLLTKFRNLPKGTGEGDGLSERQAMIALGGTHKIWGIINGMGQSSIQDLIGIVNSSDSKEAIVASIILSAWDTPQHNFIQELYDAQPVVKFNSPGQKDMPTKVIGNLANITLALSGNRDALRWAQNLAQQQGIPFEVWQRDVVTRSITFIRDSS